MNKKRWPGWKLRLPPQHRLIETGPVDAIASYYSFFIGAVLRTRLRWALDKLPDAPLSRVLEVGYGSGVLLPSLVQGTGMAVGIDIHPNAAAVHQALTDLNIPSYLIRGDATALPFTQRSFAAVLIVSALEFIPDPERCLEEVWRVLAPAGCMVAITPRKARWADAIYRLLSGVVAEDNFRGGRDRVQTALSRMTPPAQRTRMPRWLPWHLAPYEVVVWRKGS